jgi:enoyl-CoA hydratase/carnithine racemase
MEYKYSKLEKEGKLWIITLNRPEKMNALHSPAHFELEEIFNNFSSDDDAWVAIITGIGDRAFCAGNDLRYQAEGGKLERNPMGFAGLTSRFDLNKPLIAAVNGVAMGGGFEIALACDLIIASESARFALPEPKVGLAALAGGMHRLPRQIGMKRAMGMMLTGRTVGAIEGLDLGFVNEITKPEELMNGMFAYVSKNN